MTRFAPALSVACLSLVSACASSTASPAARVPAAADSVIVSAASARIVVDLGADGARQWAWYARRTPVDRLEYAWTVVVPGARGRYILGFHLFKHPGAVPDSGGLADLVRAGQVDVALESMDSGSRVARVTKMPLALRIEPTRLVFTLPDGASVAEVFGTHPSRASVQRRIADREQPRRSVAIVYAPDA